MASGIKIIECKDSGRNHNGKYQWLKLPEVLKLLYIKRYHKQMKGKWHPIKLLITDIKKWQFPQCVNGAYKSPSTEKVVLGAGVGGNNSQIKISKKYVKKKKRQAHSITKETYNLMFVKLSNSCWRHSAWPWWQSGNMELATHCWNLPWSGNANTTENLSGNIKGLKCQ